MPNQGASRRSWRSADLCGGGRAFGRFYLRLFFFEADAGDRRVEDRPGDVHSLDHWAVGVGIFVHQFAGADRADLDIFARDLGAVPADQPEADRLADIGRHGLPAADINRRALADPQASAKLIVNREHGLASGLSLQLDHMREGEPEAIGAVSKVLTGLDHADEGQRIRRGIQTFLASTKSPDADGGGWRPIATMKLWDCGIVTDGENVAKSQKAQGEFDEGEEHYFAIDPDDALEWQPTHWIGAPDTQAQGEG